MLRNMSDKPMNLSWDGKVVQVLPGQTIDIAKAYDVQASLVPPLEARFRGKFKDLVAVSENVSAPVTPAPAPVTKTEEQKPKTPAAPITKSDEPQQGPPIVDPTKDVSLSDYTKEQLLEMAQAAGLTVNKSMKKEDIIEAIQGSLQKEA